MPVYDKVCFFLNTGADVVVLFIPSKVSWVISVEGSVGGFSTDYATAAKFSWFVEFKLFLLSKVLEAKLIPLALLIDKLVLSPIDIVRLVLLRLNLSSVK